MTHMTPTPHPALVGSITTMTSWAEAHLAAAAAGGGPRNGPAVGVHGPFILSYIRSLIHSCSPYHVPPFMVLY